MMGMEGARQTRMRWRLGNVKESSTSVNVPLVGLPFLLAATKLEVDLCRTTVALSPHSLYAGLVLRADKSVVTRVRWFATKESSITKRARSGRWMTEYASIGYDSPLPLG